ncbi:MAG: hypothetical protein M0021_09060, partial [Clostridia bacterium]|nr:hypothetical protein [Clostridia bacterium]
MLNRTMPTAGELSFFEQNLEVLKEKDPSLAGRICDMLKEQQQCCANLEIIPGKISGIPTARFSEAGKEGLLHSGYDPVKESERWAAGLNG